MAQTTKKQEVVIDANKPFQFLGMEDCGETCCPHCGADGRYIYTWAEYGKVRGAMAGCYKLLTGKIHKGDLDRRIEQIADKQGRNKPLNGWDKTILRMLQYKADNANDAGKIAWADSKINEAISDTKRFAARKFRG